MRASCFGSTNKKPPEGGLVQLLRVSSNEDQLEFLFRLRCDTHHTDYHEQSDCVIDLVRRLFPVRSRVHVLVEARNYVTCAPVQNRITAVPKISRQVKTLALL